MNRILSGLASFVWMAAASFFPAYTRAELPIVNVFAPTNSVPENTNFFGGAPGSFVFTSSATNGVSLLINFRGTTAITDFSSIVQSDTTVSYRSFPTNLLIPPGKNSVTLSFRAARDSALEGTETLSVKILPEAAYIIGSSSEASFEILDRTAFGGITTNFYFSIGSTNFPLAPTLSFPVTLVGTFQNLLLRMLVDNVIADELSLTGPLDPRTNNVAMTWSNPTLGPHTVYVVSYNETGGSFQRGPLDFNVVAAVISPAKAFALRSPGGQFNGTNVIVSRYQNNPDMVGGAEFDIPASATNLNGVIKFQRASFGSVSQIVDRLDVFAYAAGPTNGADILKTPREFVGAIETNAGSNIEVDVSPWIQKFAGRKLGIILAVADAVLFSNSQYGFSKLTMILNAPDLLDTAPHIHLFGQLPKITDTNEVTIRAEICDPDSAISRVYLLEDNYVIAVDTPPTPYPPGTNVISFSVALAPGRHVLSLSAASLGKSALSEQAEFYISPDSDIAAHRWLGSQGNSEAFYVVDAAGRAHVWGRNDSGQLGLGFTSSAAEWGVKKPVTLLAPDGLKFRQIASARKYAVGLMNEGSLYIWGTKTNLTPSPNPLPPRAFAFRSIGAMESGQVAIDVLNQLWVSDNGSWRNTGSSAGNFEVEAAGDSYIIDAPYTWGSAGIQVIDSAVGGGSLYGVLSDGRLYLLNGGSIGFPTGALTAPGAATWRRVFASTTYVLAIDDKGRMFAWDRGFFVYRNSTVGVEVPFPTGVTNFVDVAVTTRIAMALTDKGELYAWGTAASGSWNDPIARVAFVPERVWGLPNLLDPNASDVAASFTSAAATSTEVTFKLASPAGLPVTIETSDDLASWNVYTNFTASGNTTTVNLPLEATTGKFFRAAP
jgi:hypothetical protein